MGLRGRVMPFSGFGHGFKGGGGGGGGGGGRGVIFVESGCRRVQEEEDKKRGCKFTGFGNVSQKCQKWN